MKFAWTSIKIFFACILIISVLTRSNVPLSENVEQVRRYTRHLEFDYVAWTLDALIQKNQSASVKAEVYLDEEDGMEVIGEYFQQVQEIQNLQSTIREIYADPEIPNPEETAQPYQDALLILEAENSTLARLCEAVLQQQVSAAAVELDLSLGGQLVPPLMYHVTPLPMALIVSPRDVIRQDANLSLQADLILEEIVNLENSVEQNLGVSALVVNIGGVGVYPTMVLRTTNLAWMIETIAHEWIHNYLTLRPLGMLYDASPELRTMNETTANLAGKEIARVVYARHYPEFLPKETPPQTVSPPTPDTPPVFDFRAEMHETRVNADQLLAEGKIEEAEAYMEMRRVFFWENGYRIRKINQAYFSFYGAYADVPGGAAGEDPVGPAVVTLREQSGSLAKFLERISWMTTFEALQQAID